jgi:hypothetical protein
MPNCDFVAVGQSETQAIPAKLARAITFIGLLEKDLRAEQKKLEGKGDGTPHILEQKIHQRH